MTVTELQTLPADEDSVSEAEAWAPSLISIVYC